MADNCSNLKLEDLEWDSKNGSIVNMTVDISCDEGPGNPISSVNNLTARIYEDNYRWIQQVSATLV